MHKFPRNLRWAGWKRARKASRENSLAARRCPATNTQILLENLRSCYYVSEPENSATLLLFGAFLDFVAVRKSDRRRPLCSRQAAGPLGRWELSPAHRFPAESGLPSKWWLDILPSVFAEPSRFPRQGISLHRETCPRLIRGVSSHPLWRVSPSEG